MMKNEISTYENENGVYKVIKQKNNVKVKLLREPSESYLKEREKIKKDLKLKQKDKLKNLERERKIKRKIREMAIQDLIANGELDE
jgi:hypothetical protein